MKTNVHVAFFIQSEKTDRKLKHITFFTSNGIEMFTIHFSFARHYVNGINGNPLFRWLAVITPWGTQTVRPYCVVITHYLPT